MENIFLSLRRKKKLAVGLMLACVFAVGGKVLAADDVGKDGEPNDKIVINIAGRSLALYHNNEKLRLYPIGPGKPSTPTPTGYYKILSKEVNPTWIDPGDERHRIPSGKHNPLGYRWMQFYNNYGIHGTNKPESIGNFVSNGCIRMFENDVEALYDLVKVGTPVEITYNRVVVEKISDGTVVYYVYPDGYNLQPLDVAAVEKWLEPFGISPFVSKEDIATKIKVADGQPTYLGKVYNILVDGKRISGKAVRIEDVMYVPVDALSTVLNLETTKRTEEGVIATGFGETTYYEKKGVTYINADDTASLFNLDGNITRNGVFELNSPPKEEPPKPAPKKPREIEPKEKLIIRTAQDVKQEAKEAARKNKLAEETAKEKLKAEKANEAIKSAEVKEQDAAKIVAAPEILPDNAGEAATDEGKGATDTALPTDEVTDGTNESLAQEAVGNGEQVAQDTADEQNYEEATAPQEPRRRRAQIRNREQQVN